MTHAPTNSHEVARYADGRFGPGNPGRRLGSRNRVSHRVAMAILEDFEAHQAVVLERLRKYFTQHYIDVVTRLLPLEIEITRPISTAVPRARSPSWRAGRAPPSTASKRAPAL